jgi:2'-5' RNA ligase
MARSALAVVIPEADARLAELRRRFDAQQMALGVPAHITVLFPFMPPEQIDDDVRRRLKRLFKRQSPFACRLARVERFPTTAYLAPMAPAPFVELTRAVMTEFPAYLPYGGAHEGIVPHLTIAHGDVQTADAAERELREEIERNGPVTAHCASVRLIEDSSGLWKTLDDFPLVGHQG